jgi:membrane protein required for colicin V production
MMFGVARGALVVCAAYLVMTLFLKPEDRPNWVVQAHTRGLLDAGAQQLRELIPRSTLERGTQAASDAAQKVNEANQAKQDLDKLNTPIGQAKPQPGGQASPNGPTQQDETDLTHLVDKALQSGSKP